MKKSFGGIIAGGVIVIIIGVIATMYSSEDSASDRPEISEDVILDEGGPGGDSLAINDSHTVSKGVEFFVDEEGKKNYVIKASDSPNLGD